MSSSLAMGGTLRHLRDLFHDGTTLGLGDGQLLARYAAARDEAAFEALVARHGPMVLATCRAVLGHEHDVEDAFQATFLVLARNARSVRAGDALGGWLHRVAYRVSIQAGIQARRRRRREAEASAMTPLQTARTGPEPDVAAIVHEEVDRLPERHRLPVVLCDLEGLTYEQAAGQLRWTVPALRCRLAKARQRLHNRLARRGLTAGALGIVLAGSTAGARAAVPATLARAAVVAATGGTASATAAALSTALIRSMVMTKLKFAAAGLMAALALVSIGAIAVGSWRFDRPGAAVIPRAVGEMKRPAPASDAPKPASAPAEMAEVRGRVIGPDGKPVAGATVRAAWLDRVDISIPEATSGPDGRFIVRVPRPGRPTKRLVNGGDAMPWIAATAPGFGPGWVAGVLRPDAPDEFTIRLVADGPPIEGRILDLEGRPVAGARLKVDRVWFARDERSWPVETGDLSAWLRRVQDRGIRPGPWDSLSQLPTAIVAATTDRDGRFRLTGIGRERIAELMVSGPTIATSLIYAMCHDGPEVRAVDRDPGRATIVFHAPRFEHAVAPTQPIEGFIRDKDTGRPIVGARIQGAVYKENSLLRSQGVEATSDDRGHYRLDGLNKGSSYRLFVYPGEPWPLTDGPGRAPLFYPNATLRVPAESSALEPVRFDITLKRGIVVRGRVTDRATGRPVPGLISAYSFRDNPHVREFPGFEQSYAPHVYLDGEGRFAVVALPGRGIITCQSDRSRYQTGIGAGGMPGNRSYFDTLPHQVSADQFHALAAINFDPGVESATVDLQVDPGRSLTIRVEDPEGRPLGGTKSSGLNAGYDDVESESPTLEVRALEPSKPRRVTITHEDRKLIGSRYLKGDESGPMTVRLQPWGTITGRMVDEEGRPRGGLSLNTRFDDILDPQPRMDRGTLPDIPIGRDGRFRVDGLVPGLKYGGGASEGYMYRGDLFRDVTLAPGEVRDLGDLAVMPRHREK
jgi:RNA polymerase sigma factor (sigma-70 family)